MKNKKERLFKVFFVAVAVIIAVNISLVYAIMPKSVAEQKGNNTKAQEEQPLNTENLNKGGEKLTLSNPVEIVEYAQKKILERVNFTTSLEGNLNANMSVFNFPIQLKTKTSVNGDGVFYTTDACNLYQEWLNGQIGYCFYGKYNSNNVYYRTTTNVSVDTCVPTFQGEFTKIDYNNALTENGIINYSNVVSISNKTVSKVEEFNKEDNIYTIKIRMNKTMLTELQQKVFVWATLMKKPSVSKFNTTFKIDEYGNLLSAEYDFSCLAIRHNDMFGDLSGVIEGKITQQYNYYNDVSFIIPTALNF